MTCQNTNKALETLVVWVSMEDSWPPIGELVMTFQRVGNCPIIRIDELLPGNQNRGQDPSLYYWSSNDDFGEISHWAKRPNFPDSLG